MSSIKALFARSRELGLPIETLRDVTFRVTNQNTLKGHTRDQYNEILDNLGQRKSTTPELAGKFLGKVQALWIAGYNLGVIRDKSDKAMCVFVKRQTGIDHVNWLKDEADALRVIEALKGWLARTGGVEWPTTKTINAYDEDPRYCVALAILAKLVASGDWKSETSVAFDSYAYVVTGKSSFDYYKSADWIKLQNALGKRLRAATKGRKNVG